MLQLDHLGVELVPEPLLERLNGSDLGLGIAQASKRPRSIAKARVVAAIDLVVHAGAHQAQDGPRLLQVFRVSWIAPATSSSRCSRSWSRASSKRPVTIRHTA